MTLSEFVLMSFEFKGRSDWKADSDPPSPRVSLLICCPSLLLVLFAGDHVPLSHVKGRRVTVSVWCVLEQHGVIVLRLQTNTTGVKEVRTEPTVPVEINLSWTTTGSFQASSIGQSYLTISLFHCIDKLSILALSAESHPVWGCVDERPVEAGGLRVEGQYQLVLAEQGLWVSLWVGLPLGERDDPPSAQSVSPDQTHSHTHW